MKCERKIEITKTYEGNKLININFILDKQEYFNTFQDVHIDTEFFNISCRIGKNTFKANRIDNNALPYVASMFIILTEKASNLKYRQIIQEFIKLRDIIEKTIKLQNKTGFKLSFDNFIEFYKILDDEIVIS